MFRLIQIFFIFALFFLPSVALACSGAPPHMYLSHVEAIEDADWIALAIGSKRADGGIEMRATEYLKGSGPERFLLSRASTEGARDDELVAAESNYYGHTSSSFWLHGGRSYNEPDCKIHPSILFGERQYLIFGPLDYNVGFENIAGEEDEWLAYVRDHLRGQNPKNPFPTMLSDYLRDAWAIVRFRAEWREGNASWTEEVLKGDKSSYAHMLFISPVAYFDTAVKPDCIRYGEPRKIADFDRIFVIEKEPSTETLSFQHVECVGADLDSAASIRGRGIFSSNGARELRVRTVDGVATVQPDFGRHTQLWNKPTVTLEQFLSEIR